MTTINEFEQQKQEILNFIFENLATPSKVSKLITLDKMIDNLQPPKPTCGTCLFLTLEDSDVTVSCKKSAFVSNPIPIMNGCQLKAHYISFGCNKHSDYEDAK